MDAIAPATMQPVRFLQPLAIGVLAFVIHRRVRR